MKHWSSCRPAWSTTTTTRKATSTWLMAIIWSQRHSSTSSVKWPIRRAHHTSRASLSLRVNWITIKTHMGWKVEKLKTKRTMISSLTWKSLRSPIRSKRRRMGSIRIVQLLQYLVSTPTVKPQSPLTTRQTSPSLASTKTRSYQTRRVQKESTTMPPSSSRVNTPISFHHMTTLWT